MAVTTSQHLGSTRLEQLVQQAGSPSVLRLLLSQASTHDETETDDFLGQLVAFIATRERLRVLGSWSHENAIARALERLGTRASADAALMRQIRIADSDRPVAAKLRGSLESHYVIGMVAARRAISKEAGTADFIERLRVLLLIRALEAAEDGHAREANLKTACTRLRQVSDNSSDPRHAWFDQLRHGMDGFEDFVSETEFKAEVTRKSDSTEGQARQLLAAMIRVARKQWTSISPPWTATTGFINQTSSIASAQPKRPGESGSTDLATEHGDDFSFAQAIPVDPSRPPAAQQQQAKGLQLLSLEDGQYLHHSWHHLSHAEELALLDRCSTLLDGPDDTDRTGAALTMVALMTSTALSSLEQLQLSSEVSDDWALDLDAGRLHRSPPRFQRRWRVQDAAAQRWVTSLASQWSIDLPRNVLDALRARAREGNLPQTLQQIWSIGNPQMTPEAWFGSRFAVGPALERLTSPAVPLVLAQQLFDQTEDHVLAKLVSSNSRTALPSTSTYGSFIGKEIQQAARKSCLAGIRTHLEGPADLVNAAGSEMDVLPEHLRQAIQQFVRRVDTAADSAEWFEHHNLLTALCVVALQASTGARPVTSPFEALSWFDLERRLIYVEDKHSGPTRGSRLCVLSDFAHDLLVERYLPHLQALADALKHSAPTFAGRIRAIVKAQIECELPLFFMLRSEPKTDWLEVSEAQLDATTGGTWPLPWNLFRHLHSTQLRRFGLHPDIRDALLSHGDKGAESHGDFSWRVPAADLEAARPLINRLTTDLGFSMPRARPPATALRLPPGDLEAVATQAYGRRARKERREAGHATARGRARADLERAMDGRPPSSLSSEQWDAIARAMLFRDQGTMPHPMASLRYEVFEGYVAALWREEGIQPRLTKRWHVPGEAVSLFTEEVIDAPRRLEGWRRSLDEAMKAGAGRAPGPALAGLLGALELALHCRVDHPAVLRAIACNSPAVQVVLYAGQYWLEWSYRGAWQDGRPVYRVPITAQAASWISIASARRSLASMPAVPKLLQSFAAEWSDAGQLLDHIASTVAQQNAFDLPGMLAAALRGRTESSALPHRDWVRTREAKALFDVEETDQESDASDSALTGASSSRTADQGASATDQDAVRRCRRLFDEIAKALAGSQTDGDGKPTVRIARAAKASGFGVGDAPYILADYACHLATRQKKTGNKATLRPKTRSRYWSSLAPGMLDFASDVNLAVLDDEDLTELYANIIEAAGAEQASGSENQNIKLRPGHARRRALRPDSDSQERAVAELRAFHMFAQRHYGLDEPDWAEIAPGCAVGGGRPGVVLLAEYQAALHSLAPVVDLTALDDRRLSSAFVLLACARFGLRTGEAVGLRRSDWVELAGSTVVLVRPSHIRPLKTTRSKRQVPLIESLESHEINILKEVMRRWELNEGRDRSRPLLEGVARSGLKIFKGQVSSTLLPLIKAVTRNPNSTVHHLRHSFACRVLAMLCQRDVRTGLSLSDNPETDAARRLLLGSGVADRRTLWSVARLLGHASPATTLKAYAHVIDSWLPPPVERPAVSNVEIGALHLDVLPRLANYLTGPFSIEPVLAPNEPLFLRYMRYLRQRKRRQPHAAYLACVSNQEARLLEGYFERASARLSEYPAGRRTLDGLLDGIAEGRWDILISAARDSKATAAFDAGDWYATIGSNRQILMFSEQHFEWGARFIGCLGSAAQRLSVVGPAGLDATVTLWVQRYLPQLRMVRDKDWSKGFQIDVATRGIPEVIHKHRVAMMPAASGETLFANTIELVVSWITWLAASSIEHQLEGTSVHLASSVGTSVKDFNALLTSVPRVDSV